MDDDMMECPQCGAIVEFLVLARRQTLEEPYE